MTDVFADKTSEEVKTDQPLVEQPKENETASEYLDRLVGPGRRYASIEDLARSRVFADEHIRRIESENQTYRDRIDKLEENYSTVTDLLHDLRERQATVSRNTPEQPTTQEAPADTNTPSLTREEVSRIVREEYEEQERLGRIEKNLDSVYNTLLSRFGNEEKANEALHRQAENLGMSMEDLKQLASTSPAAFQKLILGETQARPASSLPRSSTNTDVGSTFSNAQPEEFTWSWFEKIRHDDPARYNNPAFQTMLHQKMIEDPSRMSR